MKKNLFANNFITQPLAAICLRKEAADKKAITEYLDFSRVYHCSRKKITIFSNDGILLRIFESFCLVLSICPHQALCNDIAQTHFNLYLESSLAYSLLYYFSTFHYCSQPAAEIQNLGCFLEWSLLVKKKLVCSGKKQNFLDNLLPASQRRRRRRRCICNCFRKFSIEA